MKGSVAEIFGRSTSAPTSIDWPRIARGQECPYLGRKCIKVRKSQPDVSIGTCAVNYGREPKAIVICPIRFLERRQIFTDALHLLSLHQPGNELHVVPEMSIPGGSVDYFLVSARKGKAEDFVGIEIQTLDTTGTVWPARERFLRSVGVRVDAKAAGSSKSFGMNWKMTAKTTLVQLHHKISTFEHLSKHLALAMQDHFLAYMRREFQFGHLNPSRIGDAMHFHAYAFEQTERAYQVQLSERWSTDAAGISTALGLQAEPNVDLDVILADIERKLSNETLLAPASV